jgi:RND family efflux transporter MFP subunit
MKLRYRWLVWGSLAAACIGGAVLLALQNPTAGPAAESTPPVTVRVERGEVSQTISAPGELAASRMANLGMGASGPLAEIHVQPGEAVRSGQVLARLGGREAFAARAASARQQLLEAEQAYQALLEDAPLAAAEAQQKLVAAGQELEAARRALAGLANRQVNPATVETAQAEYVLADRQLIAGQKAFKQFSRRSERDPERALALLNLARARKQRDQALATLNWLSGEPDPGELEAAGARLALAQAARDQAQRDWERLKNGAAEDELALAESKVAVAQAFLDQAEAELQALELRAPFAGVVVQVNARPGESVNAGEGFLVLADPLALEVQASIVEESFPLVRSGMKVELYVDALPDLPLTGVLARVVPQRLPGDRPLYLVYIQLDEVPPGLAPGMTVDAAIQVERREDVLRLPRALLRAGAQDEVTVRVWKAGREAIRTVHLGLRGDLYIEVLDGLQEGEAVIGP